MPKVTQVMKLLICTLQTFFVGYTGESCETLIWFCTDDYCLNDGECSVVGSVGVVCDCPEGKSSSCLSESAHVKKIIITYANSEGSGEPAHLHNLARALPVASIYEPHHEKTCLCHMQTTKAQISLRIRAV